MLSNSLLSRSLFDVPVNRNGWVSKETSNGIKLYFDVPGVERENLQIDLQGNSLSVLGKKTIGEETSLSYNLRLPNNLNQEDVDAVLTKGVLCVTLIPNEKKISKLQIREE